ncbi:hypothetical protein SDC9_94124 [bioreactor metagenome]|uniref:PPM-type phosphatase domain-containing protein n=1 Tax=bioreactor metagenome TaxID=1076179 RepID=A0A645ACK3_9ZZZZ
MQLAPGETLVLYTDGVTEATNRDGALFGEPALLQALQTHGETLHAAQIPAHLVQAVRTFEDGAAQADDITVVALTYRGTPP